MWQSYCGEVTMSRSYCLPTISDVICTIPSGNTESHRQEGKVQCLKAKVQSVRYWSTERVRYGKYNTVFSYRTYSKNSVRNSVSYFFPKSNRTVIPNRTVETPWLEVSRTSVQVHQLCLGFDICRLIMFKIVSRRRSCSDQLLGSQLREWIASDAGGLSRRHVSLQTLRCSWRTRKYSSVKVRLLWPYN